MTRKVLDVGQCDIDNWQITNLLRNHFDVEVERAKSHGDALSAIQRQSYDLVLVNRINDTDGSEGMELIAEIKSNPETAGTSVMMVSNYADSQAAAVEAGALQGFGKSSLQSPDTLACLKRALEPDPK